MKKAILIILVLFIIAVIFCLMNHPIIVYERQYFKGIGINGAWRYRDIVADKGEPISVEQYEDRYYINYDGLVLVYDNIENGIMQSARITGKQYRFGFWRIGIGTPRKKVESVYKHIKKILDLPENEFGVIDGGTWVYFNFDENDCVSKITLTSGL